MGELVSALRTSKGWRATANLVGMPPQFLPLRRKLTFKSSDGSISFVPLIYEFSDLFRDLA